MLNPIITIAVILMSAIFLVQGVRVGRALHQVSSRWPAGAKVRTAKRQMRILERSGRSFPGHPDDWTDAQFEAVYGRRS